MRVILTGATGFVGGEVLAELLRHPGVECVTCLARRAPRERHPKLDFVQHDDFLRYESALLEGLRGHGACIWALGGKASDSPDPRTFERVTHGFTLALARAIAARAAEPFRFCYLSGMGADPTESSRLPWERATRHLKGRTEKDLQALAAQHTCFRAVCFRPGGILPRGASRVLRRALAPIALGVDDLARALIAVALGEREPASPTLSNADIQRLAARR